VNFEAMLKKVKDFLLVVAFENKQGQTKTFTGYFFRNLTLLRQAFLEL
jgi:hypothetical protein